MPGEILAQSADALATLSAEDPEMVRRLQWLTIQMLGSELAKISQAVARP